MTLLSRENLTNLTGAVFEGCFDYGGGEPPPNRPRQEPEPTRKRDTTRPSHSSPATGSDTAGSYPTWSPSGGGYDGGCGGGFSGGFDGGGCGFAPEMR